MNMETQSNDTRRNEDDDENVDVDICRVCRCEAAPDRPLFYPCVCTGSIKYIHQECLVQWLKYSKKEYCELCKHKFAFAPIYHPDMPKRLPIKDIVTGLAKTILKAIKFWLHSTLVAISWLAIVPLTACRIYRCLFAGSVSSLLTLPLDMLSTENIIVDILQGCFVVLCSLAAFISLVWLREQILSGGGPEWLNQNEMALAAERAPPQPPPRHNLLRPNNQPPQQQPPDLDANNQADVDRPPIELDHADGERPPVELNQPDPAVRNIGAAPVPPQLNNNNPQIGGIGAAADDNHWNPMEWDRAAEDLTWDRLLGLDGSLLFLEHVFWVISLNTLFILVFAFCPYHLGHYMVYGFRLQKGLEKTHFEGLITTIAGYCLLASGLIIMYALLAFSTFHRARKIIGLCYIVIKVAILVVFEICVFPLVCGLWIDACTLRLFNATLTERTASFEQSPGTSVFIHWLVGMIYVFYFATFVFLLKEVFRPGLLWFLRNLNDPDFNPIQEMIQLPVYRHIRRFVTTVTIFGFTIVLLFLVPIKLICMAQQSLLADASQSPMTETVVETLETSTGDTSFVFSPVVPYNVAQNSETLSTEMSIEVLWLHAALPAILEQSHVRIWAKNLLWLWAVCVSFVLNLRSYLLGDNGPNGQKNKPPANGANNEANNNNAVQQQVQVGQNPFQFNVGMAHQALLQNNIPCSNEPYSRPSYFKIRIALLLIVICLSLIGFSTFSLVVPVCLGRWALLQVSGNKKLNELYTVVTGMYLIWISIRLGVILYGWIQMGVQQLVLKFKERVTLFVKATLAMSMLFGLLPLLFGLLFQHIVINPITCNHDQSPVLSFWQVWALGVLHTKIATALVLTGPQWWLRHAVERVCQEGLRNLNLRFMFFNLVYPVVVCLGTTLAVPHILAKSVAPVLISDEHYLNLIERRIYPTSLFIITVTTILMLQVKQFKRLYERIRNDKYLVGQRLINFERNLVPASSHRSSPNTTTAGHSPNQSNLFAAPPQPENLHYD